MVGEIVNQRGVGRTNAGQTKGQGVMSYVDLQATLAEWPYDAEQISVRKILGTDGSIRIQMRVELGVLQMESQGSPDGAKPHGCESQLAFQRERLQRHEQRNGSPLGFVLTPRQCHDLRGEASLFYRRYVALFVLEEFEDVIRDTDHTLVIFDLCREYAEDEEDRECLETFRPYVLMMNARARSLQAEREGDYSSALAHVNRGVMHITCHYEQHDILEALDTSEELRMLRSLGSELARKGPKNPISMTQKALRMAIEKEQYEEAARLRDMLDDLCSRKDASA
jgi:hypothetical protein